MLYHWNIIGHEKELSSLEEDLRSGNIAHAYLFVGPEKIGKSRVAKELAGILQCDKNFCHSCPTCIQIEKQSHPDTIEIRDDGENIKIGMIREIVSRLAMTSQSRYKIVLIENIGRLTEEASNCLLKTLEEPTGKTVFIFTVGRLKDIMPTIASRMRRINFKKLPDEVLQTALSARHPEVDRETLNQVLVLSLGRSGRALQLLAEPELFADLKNLYERIRLLTERTSIAGRLSAAQEISADPGQTHTFIALFIHYLRNQMLQTTSPADRERHIRSIEMLTKATDLIGRNINARLVLEHILLNI